MSRGRPPKGVNHVDGIEASEQAKERLKVLLQTLSGELNVQQACERLKLSEPRFHELRQQWLSDACAALEPKPLGRPKQTPLDAELELLKLHRENKNLHRHLRAAQIREEIAIAMPHVLLPGKDEPDSKKKQP